MFIQCTLKLVFQIHYETSFAFTRFCSLKRCKGRPRPKCLPITLNILDVIHSSLHFDHYDDAILWAACCLGFFGFLHCAEFTINGRFNTQVHLSIGDIAVDHSIHSTCILVFIKASKTDPFREGVSNNWMFMQVLTFVG